MTSPYVAAAAARAAKSPKFTHTFTTNAGTPVKATLWNPCAESLAAFFECEESDVDFSENEDSDEIVKVRGEVVGKIEAF